MNRDRINRDPHSRTESGEDVTRDLGSFISESSLPSTPFKSDFEMPPLWEFPEEAREPAAPVEMVSPVWTPPRYASAASLLVAILIAAVAGAWWGRLIPGTRPVATAATAPRVESASIQRSSPNVANRTPAELTPSVEVRPLARKPVATVVTAAPREEPIRTATPAPPPLRVEARPSPRTVPPAAPSIAPPSASRLPAPSTVARVPAPSAVARVPAAEPPPAAETSPLPLPSPPATPAASLRPVPEALPSVVATRTEQSEIQRALGQYRSAYQLLDAEAARAVWPSVDVRALARAFDTLTSQELAFETCQFDIVGEAATAQCRGSATYTPKVGSRAPKLEPRQWTFQLRKIDEGWKIQTAQTRR